MKKRMAAILMCFLVLLSASAVYAEETGTAADPAAAAAAPESIAITPVSIEDTEVEIVVDSLTAGEMISFQAFYTAPATTEETTEGTTEVTPEAKLDYIGQYTLDETGAVTIDYPTRSTFAPGGTIKIIIGAADLTSVEEGTRSYTFSTDNVITKIKIRTLE